MAFLEAEALLPFSPRLYSEFNREAGFCFKISNGFSVTVTVRLRGHPLDGREALQIGHHLGIPHRAELQTSHSRMVAKRCDRVGRNIGLALAGQPQAAVTGLKNIFSFPDYSPGIIVGAVQDEICPPGKVAATADGKP